jgi:type IV pilus assembly protein PilE
VNLKRAESRLPAHYSGFTLIELMIACVILAIIVGIAVPSYQAQVRKARRTDARNAMLDIAAREERYLSIANSYTDVPLEVGYPGASPANWPVNVSNNFYNVRVTQVPAAGLVPASFLITATAINAQVADTACQTFTLDNIGTQIARDSANALNSAVCWGN